MAFISLREFLSRMGLGTAEEFDAWSKAWKVAVAGGSQESLLGFICREKGLAEDVFLQKLAQSLTATGGLKVVVLLQVGSVTVQLQHSPPLPPTAAGLLLHPNACTTYAPRSIRPVVAHPIFVIEASFNLPS